MSMRTIKILLGPAAAFCILFFTDLDPANPMVSRMAAVTVWMALWWLTESVHLAVTALIPVIFIPLFGIAEPKEVAFQYMDQIIFLFIGGFLISFAIEKWELHERIALRILRIVGSRSDRILMGVMLTAYLISMWISNTATVMMLISAVLAIVYMTDQVNPDSPEQRNFVKALLIGLAYSASIGGMTTLVGTPPNMVFFRFYQDAFPDSNAVNFASWFGMAFPVSITLLVICFITLRLLFLRKSSTKGLSKQYFNDAYNKLGKFTTEQKLVAAVFAATAVLWFTRADIHFGSFIMPGWNRFFTHPGYVQDSTVAMFMAFILFLIPSRTNRGTAILEWKDATKLPFDIILLFGSGFALAKGFDSSGLSTWMAAKLQVLNGTSPIVMVIGISALVCIISEFASNVASIQLAMPIIIAFQKDLDLNPLVLMVSATLAASLGFMLPVATAPNTIVFGSRKLHVRDMARAGFVMDFVGVVVITLVIMLFVV